MSRLLYLAYGSNLHPLRLGRRVRSAEPLGPVVVPDHEMHFCKRSIRDGSGKCTLIPAPGKRVHAAVYSMSANHRSDLDVHEGLGMGYEIQELSVETDQGACHCFTYVASPSHVDHSLLPFDWYKQLVVAGAEHFSFPAAYIQRIRELECAEDTDFRRQTDHQELLKEMLDHPGFLEKL